MHKHAYEQCRGSELDNWWIVERLRLWFVIICVSAFHTLLDWLSGSRTHARAYTPTHTHTHLSRNDQFTPTPYHSPRKRKELIDLEMTIRFNSPHEYNHWLEGYRLMKELHTNTVRLRWCVSNVTDRQQTVSQSDIHTDRQTHARARAHTLRHTHTHTQRERERERERAVSRCSIILTSS